MNFQRLTIALHLLLSACMPAIAQVAVKAEVAKAGSYFDFESLPKPAINDLGAKAVWKIAGGRADRSSAAIAVLSDGLMPTGNDQPNQNFFFAAGSEGGLIAVDLGAVQDVSQVVTYSWHSDSRAPQVYSLYAAVGDEPEFAIPDSTSALSESKAWRKLADVDTRPAKAAKDNGTRNAVRGGQHAARIANPKASLGNFRHLLFAVSPTEREDAFGNTFFSEIDVITGDPAVLDRIAAPEPRTIDFATADKAYNFTIDFTQAPELREWTEKELTPIIQQWYPKIVEMFPSEGFQAIKHVRFRYLRDTEMRGIPAYASGDTISMNADWFRGQLDREARGAVVHEMVHIVQAYSGRGRRSQGYRAPPGWIVEGIPDYVRWFLYEPQTKGAMLSKKALANAKHDASYRTSANFIDWVIRNHSADGTLVQQLNAAARQGKYSSDLWQKLTGKSEEELAEAWRSQ